VKNVLQDYKSFNDDNIKLQNELNNKISRFGIKVFGLINTSSKLFAGFFNLLPIALGKELF
jgi:hypothetical protein